MRDYNQFPTWVHAELRNWSRWCWQGSYPHPMPARKCGSIESDYQIPVYDSSVNDSPVSNVIVDIARAKEVNSVWLSMKQLPKLVIRAEYPQRESYNWERGRSGVAAQIGLCLREYEAALAEGYGKVFDHFERGYR